MQGINIIVVYKYQRNHIMLIKDTYLLQFADYPQYSIRIEQLKCSFKTLYSLLDKVAFFINVLAPNSNIAISSLYWISKDFYKPSNVSPNPLAQRISKGQTVKLMTLLYMFPKKN